MFKFHWTPDPREKFWPEKGGGVLIKFDANPKIQKYIHLYFSDSNSSNQTKFHNLPQLEIGILSSSKEFTHICTLKYYICTLNNLIVTPSGFKKPLMKNDTTRWLIFRPQCGGRRTTNFLSTYCHIRWHFFSCLLLLFKKNVDSNWITCHIFWLQKWWKMW